jgi:hypothetical protein
MMTWGRVGGGGGDGGGMAVRILSNHRTDWDILRFLGVVVERAAVVLGALYTITMSSGSWVVTICVLALRDHCGRRARIQDWRSGGRTDIRGVGGGRMTMVDSESFSNTQVRCSCLRRKEYKYNRLRQIYAADLK